MMEFKFELGEMVKIRTGFGEALILGRGVIEAIDGSKCDIYIVFFQGEKKGYFTEFELEKK